MRLPQIDHAIEICETHLKSTDSFGSEIEIYLTGYLVVFICSIFEEHIEALVHARADRSADAFLASFVRSAMDQLFRSLKTSELVGLFNRFGAEHAKRFRLELMKKQVADDTLRARWPVLLQPIRGFGNFKANRPARVAKSRKDSGGHRIKLVHQNAMCAWHPSIHALSHA